MSKCLYCEKTSDEVEFNDEHVVPQFLGGFEPMNPKIEKEYDVAVCKKCNSKFSRLETIFKEDSEEGLFSQQVNLEGSSSVRILGKRLKIESVPGFGDSFFNEIFPFLKIQDDKFVVDIKPQIKIRNYADGYQVFSIEALKTINRDSSRFKKIKQRMVSIKNEDISIFSGANSLEGSNLNEIICLLNLYRDVAYLEKERKFIPTIVNSETKWKINLQCTVDLDIARVLAKIIFNYFAYCALSEHLENLLFGKEFYQIRMFINGDPSIRMEDVILSFNKNRILGIEKQDGVTIFAHVVVFEIKQDKIIGRLSFFGINVYEIVLGEIPPMFNNPNFGCGHLFDPFQRKIFNLTQVYGENSVVGDISSSFGLFKKSGV